VGLGFLGRGITVAYFHRVGKIQVEIDVLRILVITGVRMSKIGRIMFRLIRSPPTAFEVMDKIVLSTSQSAN
jgi:hypothetical protein